MTDNAPPQQWPPDPAPVPVATPEQPQPRVWPDVKPVTEEAHA